MNTTLQRSIAAGLWLLPLYGLLTLLATLTHQPDPLEDFAAWSRYVTTTWFYWSHLVGSLLGQALGLLGVTALAVRLADGPRGWAAVASLAMTVLGSSVIFGLFGVAAFAQPAIGRAFLEGGSSVPGWYDAVFGTATLVPAVIALTVFSAATVLMAGPLRRSDRVPGWAAIGYGASGPLIGILGLAVGPLQTVGALLVLVTGIVIARRLGLAAPTIALGVPPRPA